MKIDYQKARAWLYRVLLALGGVAVFYGWLSDSEVTLWGGVLTTVLMGLPVANTPTTSGRHAAGDSGEPTTEPGAAAGAGISAEPPADGLPTTIPPHG